jgi:GNAT superfamily N-acetyltransferase
MKHHHASSRIPWVWFIFHGFLILRIVVAFSNSSPPPPSTTTTTSPGWRIPSLFRPLRITTVPTNGNKEMIVKAAEFFTDAFWASKLKKSKTLSPKQKASIQSSQVSEFRKRYGGNGRLGGGSAAAAAAELWIAQILPPNPKSGGTTTTTTTTTAETTIVGCCGIEVDTIYEGGLFSNDKNRPIRTVAPVMSNVAVGKAYRRKGIAEVLVNRAERTARLEWGYKEIYLYVEERNTPAVRLYRKLGYRPVWKDTTATALQPLEEEDGYVGMKQVPTTLICMRKILSPSSSSLWGMITRLPFLE